MRRLSAWLLPLLFTPILLSAQTGTLPQTARQALIEMFFGTAPNHLEKHLPDATRNAFRRMREPSGVSMLDQFSMFATLVRASGSKLETFDTGPILLHADNPQDASIVEITVESDNLSGDEDDIELALHVTKNDKEQKLPFIPRFTFVMKTEAEVWRLNEISVTVRVPLADPDFLKTMEQQHNSQSEALAQVSLQSVVIAENAYHSAHGVYACSLAELGRTVNHSDQKSVTVNVLSSDLASGKSGGYVFAISGCDGSVYKAVAEPDTADSGEHAYCTDESGTMRASADGKGTSCISNGEPVQNRATTALVAHAAGNQGAPPQASSISPSKPTRVRVSQAVMQSMAVSKIAPSYPLDAKTAHVQGSVVMTAIIDQRGSVENLTVISGDPLLAQAALDAVRQWKYRPYLLNGNPVEVETQITVNFTLSDTRSP